MEQNIKVSILVPFYNVEKYVGRCVESLFTQTYKNIEYVFVNDCTPDKSMDVINEYIIKYGVSEQCKIIVHEENKGRKVRMLLWQIESYSSVSWCFWPFFL